MASSYLASKIDSKQSVADLQRAIMSSDNVPKAIAALYLINNKIACFAYLTGGLLTSNSIKYLVAKHENYKDNDFTSLAFCDSGYCFFPAFRFTYKYTICAAYL